MTVEKALILWLGIPGRISLEESNTMVGEKVDEGHSCYKKKAIIQTLVVNSLESNFSWLLEKRNPMKDTRQERYTFTFLTYHDF
jgi:hypothetical protein